MRKYIPWYLGMSFIFGISFGYFFESTKLKNLTTNMSLIEKKTITLLSPASLIPGDLLESYLLENNVEIIVTYYKADQDLNYQSKNLLNYDVILTPHTKVPELRALNAITPIDVERLKNIVNIAADFRDLPTDPGGHYSIPLVWGVNLQKKTNSSHNYAFEPYLLATTLTKGLFFKTLIPTSTKPNIDFHKYVDKDRQLPSLWVQSFVLPLQSKDDSAAYDLIDFFLNSDIAIELTKLTHASSTNLAVEQTQLDSTLKPSHLRTQSFSLLAHSQ